MGKLVQSLINNGAEIAEELGKNPELIDAMQVHGGLTEGFADQDSDIDCMVYCKKQITIEKLKELINEFNYSIVSEKKDWPIRLDIKYKNHKLMLNCVETKWMLNDIKEFKNVRSNDYHKQLVYYNFLGKSHYYFDHTGKFNNEQLQNEVRELMLDKFKRFGLQLMDSLDYAFFFQDEGEINIELRRGNPLYVEVIFGKSLGIITHVLFALNNTFLMNIKWLYKHLPRFKIKPKDCEKRLIRMIKTKNVKRKIKLYREFIKDLKEIVESVS